MQEKDYIGIAAQYIEDVLSGDQIACKWVKLACQRQRDDLERSRKDPSWPYTFNPISKHPNASNKEKVGPGNHICRFIELMPQIKGEWAERNENLILQPWQVFGYTTAFGWVYRPGYIDAASGRDMGGKRRFRTTYFEMARKNGKSSLSAPMGLYMTGADGEMGAECYCAATTREQTRAVWLETAKPMVQKSPLLRSTLGMEATAHSIHVTSKNSFFRPLCAEGNSLDSLNVHCAIIDELHAHRSRKVHDVLASARGARSQPMLWLITTAGFDRSGICYEIREYLTKILSGIVTDDTFFGAIYTLDDEDDWRDESVWEKANPNLDVSVFSMDMRADAAKAKVTPSALTEFLTKRLSVWVNASVNLFDVTSWQELGNPDLKPEQFKDSPCWLGLDFAPRNDFSSRCQLFRRQEDDGIHFYVFWKHFLSEGKVEESENASYSGWAREGWIHTNEGNQTDPDEIEQDIVDIITDGYQVQELVADPSRVQGIEQHVAARTAATVVEMAQLPSNMCPAAEYLSALIADGKIHHNGDPVMAWMLSNVVGKHKESWGMFPVKERNENKIDGVTALLVALRRAMVEEMTQEPEYQLMFV